MENEFGWRHVAYGAGALVLSLSGYVVGDTLSSIRTDLQTIHTVLESRAGIPARVETVERDHADHEQRLRAVEKALWRGGH